MIIGDEVSVWYQAVIRGDVNSIRIGNRVNIQDGAVIHVTYKKASTKIGNNVSIGHNAIIHGCTIRDNVLIGMGSIVMDNCEIGSNTIIAAGAVVTSSTKPFSLNVGVPARQVGWVSKRGDIIDLPLSGNGEHICKKDNAVYKLINNNLVVNKL